MTCPNRAPAIPIRALQGFASQIGLDVHRLLKRFLPGLKRPRGVFQTRECLCQPPWLYLPDRFATATGGDTRGTCGHREVRPEEKFSGQKICSPALRDFQIPKLAAGDVHIPVSQAAGIAPCKTSCLALIWKSVSECTLSGRSAPGYTLTCTKNKKAAS